MQSDEHNPYAAPQAELQVESQLQLENQPDARVEKRFLNVVIDQIVVFGLIICIDAFLATPGSATVAAYVGFLDQIELFVRNMLLLCGYYLIMEGRSGRTIGKYITGTQVLNFKGERPGFIQIAVRTLLRMVPFEAVSFMFGSDHRGWHDNWSSTRVIDLRANPVEKRHLKAAWMR